MLDDDGEQVEGFQVHLGGALGLEAGFGRKLRAHKVTSAGLDDYVTTVVGNYLHDRGDAETFATWAARADEIAAARREVPVGGGLVSARAVPFHCPYCGEEDLFPHDTGSARHRPTAPGNAGPACGLQGQHDRSAASAVRHHRPKGVAR